MANQIKLLNYSLEAPFKIIAHLDMEAEKYPLILGCSLKDITGKIFDIPINVVENAGYYDIEINIPENIEVNQEILLPDFQIVFSLWKDQSFTDRIASTDWKRICCSFNGEMFDFEKQADIIFNDIIVSYGESMDIEVIAQMKSDWRERIDNIFNRRLLENIPKDKLDEFESTLDDENNEGITDFIRKYIPDISQIIIDTFEEFRKLYIKV
ncbi:MAG TPA: DUF5663 domain-containing protein [Ignavibacteria bacterium]